VVKVILFSIRSLLFLVLLFTIYGFSSQTAGPDFSAYDVINAVNNLRISQGLNPLQINATIMSVAQAHTDYQAITRRSSHADSSGGIVNDRVAASGYGAGNKFVAGENVANLDLGITDAVPIIINEIWADAGHRGAMLNPKYQDIGVGVASDGKMVYVTLNLAGIVSSGSGAIQATSAVSTTLQPTSGGAGIPGILPLVTSTPLTDGSVYHIVGYGQTLGTIARIYQVDVKDLVRLNNIDPDKIYAGQKLWIKKVAFTSPSPSPSTSPANLVTGEMPPTGTIVPSELPTSTTTTTPTPTPLPPSEPANTREIGIIAIFIFFTAVLVFLLISKVRLQKPD
jgi:LysM repeat protein